MFPPKPCNVFERLDVAYSKFFAGGGFPKWAKKGKYNSLLFKSVKFNNGTFELPKLGSVKVFKDRRPEGILKTATVIKENYGYFLSVSVETESTPQYSDENQVGIDVGIVHFCSDSNGQQVANPRHFLRYEGKLRIENRALARKKKGSYGWRKQKARLNKLHAKIARVRKDFLHQQSTRYVRNNHLIVVENLKVSNMVQFGNLSRHIADTGWSSFKTMLAYKCAFQEKEFVAVKPHYTSQTCCACGHVAKENRTSQAVFVCISCGYADNADVNAAKNILGLGKAFVRQREALVCA